MRRQRRDRWGDERVIEFLAPFLALEANKFGAIYCPNRPIEIDQQQQQKTDATKMVNALTQKQCE